MMEGSARGANLGGAAGAGDVQGDSPLAALSGIANRLRGAAGERLGPDAAERLRNVAGEKLKSVGGDRLQPGGDRLRSMAGGLRDPAGATAGLEPFEERPELYVGAAFAGGLALAGLIRLLGR